MATPPLIAGVELGGTKCLAILASGPDDIRDTVRLPTGAPAETLPALASVLARWRAGPGFEAIGIASFGPVGLDRSRGHYGHITRTPKPGWSGVDVVGALAAGLDCPIGFETDVNGAALAEGRWGGARGLADHAYVTIGTGVGVGSVVGGRPLLGAAHMEFGHIRVPRRRGDDWPGACPFHGDCLEGLVSGPALGARFGMAGHMLPPDHAGWDLFVDEVAAMLHALVLATWPRRIAIGGGVIAPRPELFGPLSDRLRRSLGGYGAAGDSDIVGPDLLGPPLLGDRAGPLGAIAVGLDALDAAVTTPRH